MNYSKKLSHSSFETKIDSKRGGWGQKSITEGLL